MKHIIPLFLLAASTFSAQAQWTTDVSMNTPVSAAGANDATTPMVADGPDGSTYACWFEIADGDYQLRMQRLDPDGNPLWVETGLVVSDHPQNSAIFRYDMKSDADGNAVVAFQDERTGVLDIVAYKIAPDGSFLWGADGVELPTPGTTGLAPSVAPLSNGNTAVSWNTDDSPRKIAVQLVDPTGVVLLTDPIEITASTNVSSPVPIPTSDGGFILQYGVSVGGFGLPPWTMYAQRYDDEGNAVWADAIQVSSKTIAFFYFPLPVSDGQDGFYLAFNTGNPDNGSYTDVYVQRVRGDGSLWSTEGTRMDNSSSTQKFTAGKGLAWIDDDAGLMVPLQVTDGAQGQSGVSVQRVDTAGTTQLGTSAVVVIPVSASYFDPEDITATADGAVILHSTGTFGQEHLGATRVDLDGTILWSPAQMDISTANSNKDDLSVTSVRDGQAVVVWQDDRSMSGIYAQNIPDLEMTTGIAADEFTDRTMRLESNPATSPVLLFQDPLPVGSTLFVFDAQGRSILRTAAHRGDTRIELPLSSLPRGSYIIRMVGPDRSTAVRWMK